MAGESGDNENDERWSKK